MVKQTPDNEGPIHPQYPDFNLRRCLHRISHYYHHPHRRHEEIIDVIAIRSVMASASSASAHSPNAVWEDNSPESLFTLASKCILANPGVLFRYVLCARCLKITEKVSFNIASEASYTYILSGQKLIKNAKNGPFWRVFENL